MLCTTTFVRSSSACLPLQNLHKQLLPRAGKDCSQPVKISEVSRGLHCLNEVCNCRDVMSVNSLNSPGRFSLPKQPENEARIYLEGYINQIHIVHMPCETCLVKLFRQKAGKWHITRADHKGQLEAQRPQPLKVPLVEPRMGPLETVDAEKIDKWIYVCYGPIWNLWPVC